MTAFSKRLAWNISMKSHLFCVYHKRIQSLLQKFLNRVDTSVKTFPVEKKKERVLEGIYWWQKGNETWAKIAHALVYCWEWKPNLLKYKHAWYSKLKKKLIQKCVPFKLLIFKSLQKWVMSKSLTSFELQCSLFTPRQVSLTQPLRGSNTKRICIFNNTVSTGVCVCPQPGTLRGSSFTERMMSLALISHQYSTTWSQTLVSGHFSPLR